jgi:AhpD family alkylhydroperoxidase
MSAKELNRRFAETLNKLAKRHPKFIKAFHSFFEAAEGEGALGRKTKELISVALAVKSQCPYCIAFHVKNALELGATEEEIIESAYLAVLMGGGPALAYMSYVFDALEEFSDGDKPQRSG